ncbi:MAG: AbrB/MazE/SpoVT family DNA-binding domain-containing protein [Promethearchaeota archaeon]
MSKIVNMTNRGMITIPASIRKKYNLQDGQPLAIIDQEDKIILIPIIDFEKERKNFLEIDEMKKILENLDEEEMKLEEI